MSTDPGTHPFPASGFRNETAHSSCARCRAVSPRSERLYIARTEHYCVLPERDVAHKALRWPRIADARAGGVPDSRTWRSPLRRLVAPGRIPHRASVAAPRATVTGPVHPPAATAPRWISNTRPRTPRKNVRSRLTVYDGVDRVTESALRPGECARLEHALLERADLVFTESDRSCLTRADVHPLVRRAAPGGALPALDEIADALLGQGTGARRGPAELSAGGRRPATEAWESRTERRPDESAGGGSPIYRSAAPFANARPGAPRRDELAEHARPIS